MEIEQIKKIIESSVLTRSNYGSTVITYTFETEESQKRNIERGLYLPCLSLNVIMEDKIIQAYVDTETIEGTFEYRGMEYYQIMDCLANNKV